MYLDYVKDFIDKGTMIHLADVKQDKYLYNRFYMYKSRKKNYLVYSPALTKFGYFRFYGKVIAYENAFMKNQKLYEQQNKKLTIKDMPKDYQVFAQWVNAKRHMEYLSDCFVIITDLNTEEELRNLAKNFQNEKDLDIKHFSEVKLK